MSGDNKMQIMMHRSLKQAFVVFCGLFAGAAYADSDIQNLDCRHLFAEEVRVSDQVSALKKKKAIAEKKGTDTDNNGFYVKLDPIPSIGVMNGVTLTPAGKPLKEDISDERINKLELQLADIRKAQEHKVCPAMTLPDADDERLLDEQTR
ncbi:hypothetical protein [Acetobacter pasteurianus]|uniref:Uncharacterized protein n=2 Tax=Acetobacter pasteurianus TaxID=438 RepID=C7JF59_ACEP3|nr:hypothetical protein [Acetobacter pasteurianus]BAI00449.1 hypothetical protein APA01_23360 [Acetobacter pasteurianus IFO 3283-01]BAI03500.1 hypothetical protein APA03_23360 [Acetobacter pasteurianus IFO 3283-03]BAI06545.1 hypothetical protein APA07_23360 [Acetobacter pasteurianus IFO 3283-07]BAI09595.1 hypothetical protein APA22_23360 [Acetobacter pasteurianus IFO 3283-22]BAI12643.1 hypothetical protein APA26_23360 [Acetobacter pasteurianus IFO 3283-26]BAI15689.1 hypothetical protein APA32